MRLFPKNRVCLSTFTDLGVLPEIADALESVGITTPFPIQQMTLPIALMGTDLIGQARTGTGKTLAFGIPVLQRIVAPHDPDYAELVAPGKPQALVICPTRELALQVSGDLKVAGAKRGTRTLTVYGGVGYDDQLNTLDKGVDVVVGTPGRLNDLASRRALDLAHVKVLVLDEADEMLDLGFLPDVERLLSQTPELRQTMLFSATMPGAIIGLARTYMRHPVNIRAESTDETQTVPATAQFVYQVHDLDKPEIIARILQAENSGRCIVFTRTKRQAQRVADDLTERGFSAAPLHGDMPQVAREKALKRFRQGTVTVLVATDVAARGIDVEAVTHVINYSCPEDDKTYLHRIGRTGRAGATGIAVTFVDWADLGRWKLINKALDLPFDEPLETYSTSSHLYHDMGVPAEAKGRIRPAATTDSDEPRRARRGDGSERAEETGRPERTARRRNRNRRRTRIRDGQPVETAEGPGSPSGGNDRNRSGSSASNRTEHPEDGGQEAGSAASAPRSRDRRRRRRGGGRRAGGDNGETGHVGAGA
jgi:superfamily II DNA/RNA helicase